MERDNLILSKTIEFSGKIIQFTRKLKQIQEFDIARQLFKSGTSIGANIHEAQFTNLHIFASTHLHIN